MSAIMSEFNASVYITEQLNRLIVNAAMDLAKRSVAECASKYEFDAEDAFRFLGLQNVKLERSKPVAAKKAPKEKAVKMAFPLPYNGECAAGCCSALRQNQGLYTQCTAAPKKGQLFCKACQVNADKNGGVPEYGTITMRQSVGIFEYVDPKGRKPVAYTKLMKKYKVDQVAVMEEAAKFGIKVNDEHFVAPAETSKGRPKKEKVEAKREKGAKGRPKKDKKKLQIEGDDDDLFASLVADANATASAEPAKKKGKSDEEKEAERIAKENEKKEKEAKRAAEKAEKEAKEKAEKEAKAAKAAEEKAARELKKKQEEDEKLAKKAAAELAKKEKEAKLAAEKAEKEAKKAVKKPVAKPEPEPEVEEEPDVVKKIEFEGKKYLKSKKTGIIYDYTEYVKNGEQVVVGKWNDDKNKIDFANKEEEEEEYTM